MFRLTFLGTSSGVPTKARNVSALAVECIAGQSQGKNHAWVLVDCGEGTQHQLMKTPLSLANLSAILITHAHGDHCYGLAGLLASLSMNGRKTPLTLIAPTQVIELIHHIQALTELRLSYGLHTIATQALLMHDNGQCRLSFGANHWLDVRLYELSHRCFSVGFALTQVLKSVNLDTAKLKSVSIEKDKWRLIANAQNPDLTVQIDGKDVVPSDFIIHQNRCTKIVIAGDNDNPDLLKEAVVGAKALVHEATYTDDIRQKILSRPPKQGGFDPKHSSVVMVARFAHTHYIPTLVLTHFSARYAPFDEPDSPKPNMGHIKQEVQRVYQGNLILAKDFLSVVVDDEAIVYNKQLLT